MGHHRLDHRHLQRVRVRRAPIRTRLPFTRDDLWKQLSLARTPALRVVVDARRQRCAVGGEGR